MFVTSKRMESNTIDNEDAEDDDDGCRNHHHQHHQHHCKHQHHQKRLLIRMNPFKTNQRIDRQRIFNQFLFYGSILLLTFGCYSNSLDGDFVHDDLPAIVQNSDVIGTNTIEKLFWNDFWGKPIDHHDSHKSYRPITTLTFRLNMMISTHTFGFHLINLILHCIVTIMVSILASEIFRFQTKQIWLITALFATHPIHCEAVSSIVGRSDVLCAFFYLIAFFLFHKSLWCSGAKQHLFLTFYFLACLLSLLSKEIGITVTGVCAFYWLLGYQFQSSSNANNHHRHHRHHSNIDIDNIFDENTIKKINKNRKIPIESDSEKRISALASSSFFFSSSSSYSSSSTSIDICCHHHHRNHHFRQHNQSLGPMIVTILSFITLMTFRLKMLGETWPLFSEQDNPASYSRCLLTRILTYLYLTGFNLRLLLNPFNLAYDWQTSGIRLVRTWNDSRNLQTIYLLLTFFALVLRISNEILHRWRIVSQQRSDLKLLKPQRINKTPLSPKLSKVLLSLLFLSIPYLPASNLFITVGFVVAERLLYLPSIGLICLICCGLERIHLNQYRRCFQWCQTSLFLLVIVFALKTYQQNQVWNNRESLYRSGIVNVPENAKAHYNYGNWQQEIGNWNDAIYHYKTAIRLWPDHASAHNNLGTLYWKISKIDQAEKHFSRALTINPYHAKAHFNLGKIFSRRGRTNEAIFLLERSIRLDRRFGESYEALAALYAEIGHLLLAERFYRQAIRLRPRNSDFFNNYGAFLQKTGRLVLAQRNYRKALELRPNHQIAMINTANLLIKLNRFDQAERFYLRAMRIRNDFDALDQLGALYLRRSKLDQAREVYEKIWYKFSTKQSSVSDRPLRIGSRRKDNDHHHHHHQIKTIKSPLSANIHYAQLLILEERFEDAEVLLETLANRFNDANIVFDDDDDDREDDNDDGDREDQDWNRNENNRNHHQNNIDQDSTELDRNQKKSKNRNESGPLDHPKIFFESNQTKQKQKQSFGTERKQLRSRQSNQIETKQKILNEQRYQSRVKYLKNEIKLETKTFILNNNVGDSRTKTKQTKTKMTIEIFKMNSTIRSIDDDHDDHDDDLDHNHFVIPHHHQRQQQQQQHRLNFEYKYHYDHNHHHHHHHHHRRQWQQQQQQQQHHHNSNHKLSGTSQTKRTQARAGLAFQIDVFNQLARLYTLTNRTAESLDLLAKAIRLCRYHSASLESSIDKTAGNADINDDDDDDRIATNYQNDDDDHRSNEFENLLHKCAQILTLKGDILKDFNRWQDAIESYKQAIDLDQCSTRAHLHLAVIYHLGGRYTQAMIHYTMARQLDSHGDLQDLIDENISKLRFRFTTILSMAIDNEEKITGIDPKSTVTTLHCRSRYDSIASKRINEKISIRHTVNDYHNDNDNDGGDGDGDGQHQHQHHQYELNPFSMMFTSSSAALNRMTNMMALSSQSILSSV